MRQAFFIKCARFTTLAAESNAIAVLLFFRNIQFTTAFSLAVYIALLHFAALSGHLTLPPSMDDAGLPFDGLFGWLETRAFWSAAGAALLVFFQALIVNSLVDQFRLMNDRNWLPGMGYALVVSALPDFLFLSAPLFAATFVLFSLRSVFNTYKSPKSAVLVFDSAFWISVSSLFYPNAMILIIALFFGVGVMRSWSTRDRMVFLTGIFVPVFLGWLWYFWHDSGDVFRSQYVGNIMGWPRFDMSVDPLSLLKCTLLGFFLLLFILNFNVFSRNKSMQGQKCVGVLFWVLFVGTGAILLRPHWRFEAFAMIAAPAGIFMAMYFQNLRKFMAEILHLLIAGFVMFIQYFWI